MEAGWGAAAMDGARMEAPAEEKDEVRAAYSSRGRPDEQHSSKPGPAGKAKTPFLGTT